MSSSMKVVDKVNVLLVDDQPQKLLTYEAALASLGENLIKVDSGTKALQVLLQEEVAAILLDVNMPVLDGFETAAMIRQHPRFESVPIIFVTGVNTTDMDRLKGYELGAVDYVYVPVIPEILRAKVGVFVELFRKTRELVALNRELEERAAQLEEANRELKETELDLACARDAALQSARLKSAFLANMSHEIRTPLNIILGYNALIADEFAMLDERSRSTMIEGARRAGNRLTATIDGILDISKIETGNFEVKPVRLALASVLERQLEELQILAREKGLSLSCEVEERESVIRFDEYCFTNAVMNLLQNAIKFTPRGSVRLRLHRDQAGVLCLDVQDTGIGIDPSYLPHIFEAFSQGESGYARRFEGSGLGLTLTRRYLELNGAQISIDSERGRGSTFRIRFSRDCEDPGPANTEEAPPFVRRRALPLESLRTPTILVVEDDPDTQVFMRQILGKRYQVLFAASGEEVRRLLLAHRSEILLVLMDLSLRGSEDGLMLTRALRAEDVYRDLPIIAITAHAFPEDRVKSLAAGCNAYLAKPIRGYELFSLIEELRNLRGAAATERSLQ